MGVWPLCERERTAFLTDNVELGARVITDGWRPYRPATAELYVHEPLAGASRAEASKLLPGVHKVSSLAKRWLLGTHQGSVDDAHLASYLNEFVFSFNRRRSRSRGLVFYRVLELAADHDPRYRDLIANPRPGRRPPLLPGHPQSPTEPGATASRPALADALARSPSRIFGMILRRRMDPQMRSSSDGRATLATDVVGRQELEPGHGRLPASRARRFAGAVRWPSWPAGSPPAALLVRARQWGGPASLLRAAPARGVVAR